MIHTLNYYRINLIWMIKFVNITSQLKIKSFRLSFDYQYKYRKELGNLCWKIFFQIRAISFYLQISEIYANQKEFSTSVKKYCRSWRDSACVFEECEKDYRSRERELPRTSNSNFRKSATGSREKVWCWVDRGKLRANPMFPAKIRK